MQAFAKTVLFSGEPKLVENHLDPVQPPIDTRALTPYDHNFVSSFCKFRLFQKMKTRADARFPWQLTQTPEFDQGPTCSRRGNCLAWSLCKGKKKTPQN